MTYTHQHYVLSSSLCVSWYKINHRRCSHVTLHVFSVLKCPGCNYRVACGGYLIVRPRQNLQILQWQTSGWKTDPCCASLRRLTWAKGAIREDSPLLKTPWVLCLQFRKRHCINTLLHQPSAAHKNWQFTCIEVQSPSIIGVIFSPGATAI